MGGIEDGEPPLKRVKVPLEGSDSYLEGFTRTKFVAESFGKSMARSLPSQGDGETIGSKGVIKKPEFIKIITRALYSLGYDKSGALLEEESGIPLHSSVVSLFTKQVLDGKWDESVATLHTIGLSDETIEKSATLLILEQKFFEFLGMAGLAGVNAALNTLQNEIVPLCNDVGRVRDLAACMISSSQCEIFGFSIEDIGGEAFRSKTLEKLQKLLPASVLIPDKRLEHLVEQALDVQRDACTFHNTFDSELSLYSDHQCGKNHIPSQTLKVREFISGYLVLMPSMPSFVSILQTILRIGNVSRNVCIELNIIFLLASFVSRNK